MIRPNFKSSLFSRAKFKPCFRSGYFLLQLLYCMLLDGVGSRSIGEPSKSQIGREWGLKRQNVLMKKFILTSILSSIAQNLRSSFTYFCLDVGPTSARSSCTLSHRHPTSL